VDYLPELIRADPGWSKVTLQHLLDMRSGVKFKEQGRKIDDAIKLGLRPNVVKHALKLKLDREPGGAFVYQSVNTEYLALVIERATGKKISEYLKEKIWMPLGMEHDANWNVDSKKRKQEIAFAGINAIARDFAKLGRLYLNDGAWNGTQILDAKWVRMVNNADSMEKMGGYHNQWWSRYRQKYFKDSLSAAEFKNSTPQTSKVRKIAKGYSVGYRTEAFHAAGMLNQYVYIHPKSKVVIVRLGRFWSHPKYFPDMFLYELGGGL
jgi:CubicO group peptidase (beta-lactamase class C family)